VLPVLDLFTTGRLTSLLRSSLDVWDTVNQVRDRVVYHGMYEILDYDATLEIHDSKGKSASLVRHETIRFLQDNVVAIHDHAWGDGELFAEYNCQPGIPVDFYEDGSKWNVLISLRETKNRGDVLDLWIERVIEGGLFGDKEWLETEIDHRMHNLELAIIFPAERRCQRATLTRRSTSETVALGKQHFSFLGDGRQKLTFETNRPKLHDRYTIKWDW
jgi:hypothetical protein